MCGRTRSCCLFAATLQLTGSPAVQVAQSDESLCAASNAPVPEGPAVKILSEAPRVFLLEGFLNASEMEHLRHVGKDLGAFGTAAADPKDPQDHRGYHQVYVQEEQYSTDPILAALEARISAYGHIPFDPGSAATISLSVRNATEGGMTNLHHDHNAAAMALMSYAKRGIKVPLTELQKTLLAYFSDTEGGETVFPCICDRTGDGCRKAQKICKFLYEHGVLHIHPKGHNQPFKAVTAATAEKLKKASESLVQRTKKLCTQASGTGHTPLGMRVQAKSGRAILFYSNTVRGEADPRAWHGSCRVTAGQKLALQRFLYAPGGDEETGEHASAKFTW